MASQKKPPAPDGPDGTGGPSVRRAVSLGSAAADPGPMLAPAARRTAAPEPGEGGAGGAGEAETARPAPGTAESEAAPEQSAGTGATTGEPGAATAEPGATAVVPVAPDASASRLRPEAENGTTTEPAATEPLAAARAAATVPDAKAEAAGGVGGAGGTAAAGGAGADGPPSGNPKKPLVAAAGIAGVVLLAVPLLIWATDDSRQKKDDVAVAAGSDTLLEEEPLEVPKGDYAPAEPTPRPSTERPSAEPSPVVEEPAAAPSSAPAAVPAEAVTEKAETRTKKKAEPRVEEHKAPVLPPNTAAYAVQRLAASSPGRHICYRVHAKGAGWTAPVCDGATAGQEGKGRPVTAINIAVSDAKRVNGNEFVQKDGWTTKWSGAADGTDLTLGSAASNAPNLSGFTVGVESGNVCQNHKLGKRDWGGLACESPQGWIFGGSTEPRLWLEAVRFTV
ncbi:putative hydrolytic protein [Streptomyces ambofaciens ATCC 23877]|uniref:Putative hydrolytic protein n=1 Tax=Streptomyces ambofaciens (strain ATCC 23877 / 3486 / DSM 40053 / JCM 4204 / NBRC 12836 / NRRL B-2516) TaxID=278992 RepID=A3KJT5_STRA7|nr:hypothetical protein [Streptomyces ambofaciens]AKZ54124.1 putative hydrolytic protein [Streptomyces ambofaciens ATCC 23877]CAJ89970.1 putative hydrolytic protein [Streptomyces ambofaciens ATCC 23877]